MFSVVLDEVDILFGDEGFEQVLQSLINSAPMEAQYLFVTATLPVDIYKKLVQVFPDCEVTMGPGIHRTSSKLEEVSYFGSSLCIKLDKEDSFIDLAYGDFVKVVYLKLLVEPSMEDETSELKLGNCGSFWL